MPLPAPTLDDRHFQDIVDEAKKLIPRFCPEWTDHNVSDPGIALIELFAWMTDMLLYRANRIPEKVYVKFLELLGAQLAPPQPARAPVAFYLAAPVGTETRIPVGTPLSTAHTDREPPRLFTTESDLVVSSAQIVGALTRAGPQPHTWTRHDLQRLAGGGADVTRIFPAESRQRDGFYLAFDRDRAAHLLHINVNCRHAKPFGINPDHPPIVWETLHGDTAGMSTWCACEVEQDSSGGFSRSGSVTLHVPWESPMRSAVFQGLRGYWLRCRLTSEQADNGYGASPELESLDVQVWGGTVIAAQATRVEDEPLGVSEGTPRQQFRLRHAPIVRDGDVHCVLVKPTGDRPTEEWHEVDDFSRSGPNDRHFTLDYVDGSLCFGPALLQPDGRLRHFGQVPRRGARLTLRNYTWGGGARGNVAAYGIGLHSAVPHVQRATNRRAATGGTDLETLEHVGLRLPELLRRRTRAVTAADYEWFASQVPGVARARCLPAGAQPPGVGSAPPGEVWVAILPMLGDSASPALRPRPQDLVLRPELKARVEAELAGVSPLGIRRIEARQVQCTWVSVKAALHLQIGYGAYTVTELAQARLGCYLSPYVGGPDQNGWPFGRLLRRADIYALLQAIPGVEFVENVALFTVDENVADDRRTKIPADARGIATSAHGLLCGSDSSHDITTVPPEAG